MRRLRLRHRDYPVCRARQNLFIPSQNFGVWERAGEELRYTEMGDRALLRRPRVILEWL